MQVNSSRGTQMYAAGLSVCSSPATTLSKGWRSSVKKGNLAHLLIRRWVKAGMYAPAYMQFMRTIVQ